MIQASEVGCGGGGQSRTETRLASPKADRLVTLPEEVLMRVFEIVGTSSMTDLCHVALLNKRYHKLVDSILYRNVRFDTPELHLIFSESLSHRPRRGSAIEDITLEYPSSALSKSLVSLDGSQIDLRHNGPSRVDALSRALSAMSNLKKLTISVPDSLAHGIGTLFNGPFDLACLKTCTLFYQCEDDGYWDLQDNIHIFAHPSLESLVIKRAKLDEKGFDSIERPYETALKKLHLIECDINDDALSDVLEFPGGLKEFVMTQHQDPNPELTESSDDVAHYITALKSQGPTLQSITIDFPTLKGYKPLRMRDFEALRTLRINWDHQLFGATSKKPRMHSVGLPPELETLEFFNELGTDETVTDLLVASIQTSSILARKWTSMVVVANEDGEIPKEVLEACLEQEHLKLEIIGGNNNNDDGGDDDDGLGESVRSLSVFEH